MAKVFDGEQVVGTYTPAKKSTVRSGKAKPQPRLAPVKRTPLIDLANAKPLKIKGQGKQQRQQQQLQPVVVQSGRGSGSSAEVSGSSAEVNAWEQLVNDIYAQDASLATTLEIARAIDQARLAFPRHNVENIGHVAVGILRNRLIPVKHSEIVIGQSHDLRGINDFGGAKRVIVDKQNNRTHVAPAIESLPKTLAFPQRQMLVNYAGLLRGQRLRLVSTQRDHYTVLHDGKSLSIPMAYMAMPTAPLDDEYQKTLRGKEHGTEYPQRRFVAGNETR